MKTISIISFLLLFSLASNAQNPHPILRYLNADLVDGQVRLSWVISGGNTCSGIVIQRSGDGQFFETIGEIDGICGSPDVDIPYVFLDTEPLPGQLNYYRLELGTQGYSSAVSIEFVPLNGQGYAVKYNPVSKVATVYFDNDANNKFSYRLFTVSGHQIYEGAGNGSQISIDLSGYASMMYLLKLNLNNKAISIKVPGF